MTDEENTALSPGQLTLALVFVTGLVTSQVTAAKVVAVGLPFAIPVTGDLVTVPAAVFAYGVTYFASDCYTELFGKRAAQRLVNTAFVMNFVFLALVGLAIAAPVFANSPVGQAPFAQTLGASSGVVVASLGAYLISQNADVILFERLRTRAGGSGLWFRNIVSTAASQMLDTVIFITVAFSIFQGVPLRVTVGLIIGQYLFKLLLVIADTPLVYAAVGVVRYLRQGDRQ
jgi:hypothetical protein